MHFNRNKRSLALDLKREEGRDALHRLLATADVFIANVRPAALDGSASTPKACAAAIRGSILCNLMGFGQRRTLPRPPGLRHHHPGLCRA